MSTDQLWISETFVSRQGEGRLAGTDSHFVRLSGCNLRCWFCDTPYASWYPEGQRRSVDSVLQQVAAAAVRHVVLTGGEPLLRSSVESLLQGLQQIGVHVTVETAGTLYRDVPIDLVSISPKFASSGPAMANPLAAADARQAVPMDGQSLPYSDEKRDRWQQRHEAARWRPEVIRQLIAQAGDHQIKFVVDDEGDFWQACAAVSEIGVQPDHVWIMPQGLTAQELDEKQMWLLPLCQQQQFHYCDRLHIRWYGNKRGT